MAKIETFLQRYRILLISVVVLLFLCRFLSWQIPSASTNFLWGDEAGNVFVWNQGVLTPGFFAAARTHIMAPPLDHLLASLWWKMLNLIAPEWCRAEMELAMRTYPMFMLALGLAMLFAAAFVVSNSAGIVLLLAALLVEPNPVLAYIGIELKFHASQFFFTSSAWLAFVLARRELAKAAPSPWPFWLWLILGASGVWTHFFAAISTMIQAGLLALFFYRTRRAEGNLARFKLLRLGWMSAVLTVDAGLLFAYAKFYANQPPPFVWSQCKSVPAAVAEWTAALTQLLPFLGIYWLVFALGAGVIRLRSRQASDFPAIVSQFVMLGVCFGTVVFPWLHSCRNYYWGPRYINFMFPLAFLCVTQALAWGMALLQTSLAPWLRRGFVLAGLVLLVALAPAVGKPHIPGGDSFVRLRHALQQEQLHVKGVIGIHPRVDRSLAVTDDGTWLGMTWELYLKGPQGLPKILEFTEANKNGGFEIIASETRESFPVIAKPAPGEEVYVDLGDPKQIVLRRPKAEPVSSIQPAANENRPDPN
jgi:hypothetical protein